MFWLERLKNDENNNVNPKYSDDDARNYQDVICNYNIASMADVELRDILIEELGTASDEKVKIILCAGTCNYLSWSNRGLFWLERFSQQKIKESIINFKSRELIRYRQHDDFQKYYRWNHRMTADKGIWQLVENWPDEFSDDEVGHFISLNDRLIELQHEVMDQVKVITSNLQQQIAKGFHQFDTFYIDGSIYIEPYEEDDTDDLLDVLCDFAKYSVIHSNDDTKIEILESDITEDRHWYANWSGAFHQLLKSHDLKLCRAFRNLFEEAQIFTVADILKIKPKMLMSQVKIYI